MEILFDGRGINWYKGTGIGTYTYNLLKYIYEIDKKNSYHLFWSGNNYSTFNKNGNKVIMASKKHQRFFENHYIPNYIERKGIDIYHMPQNGLGLTDKPFCKKVVTIHDLIPYVLPETVGAGYLKHFLSNMPAVIDNTDAIITVSEYSKLDILKFFPNFNPDNIYVTPLAANPNYKVLDKEYCANTIKLKFNINCPYILYVGGFSQRKNVKSLIDAFNEVYSSLNKKYTLVIAGSLKDEGEVLLNYTKTLPVKDNIKFCGYISDDYLPILYNAADVFVYPSRYEGFGLPPLESMSCGTPVISSNTTSIPEVINDCGLLINPDSQYSISKALVNLLNDTELYKSLRIKGLERASKFSWYHTATNTLNAYQAIVEKN